MPERKSRKFSSLILERLDSLANSDGKSGVRPRPYLSRQHLAAARLVKRWMQAAGMSTVIDAAGTVVGRYEPKTGGRTLIIGSYIDTAADAGRFSGALGVLLGIEVIAELNRRRTTLSYGVEVMAFGDDIAGRFSALPVGSRAIAGLFSSDQLDARDGDGVVLRRALLEFGGAPDQIGRLSRSAADLIGFIEVHTEQGPMLEAEGLPVGVVTAIGGISRLEVTVTGAAGHASTMPFAQRRDALTAAAEMVLATEILCRQVAGLSASTCNIAVEPARHGSIAAVARFHVEVSAAVDRTRRGGVRDLERALKAIARRRRCQVEIKVLQDVPAVNCDARFIMQLSQSAENCGVAAFGMPSGIGNGGSSFAQLCPVGMLLLRCKGGVSQHASELVKAEDIEAALKVLLDFLINLDMIGER